MHIFLSWSGEESRQIAIALRHWLPTVLPNAKPWMSDHDIEAGDRWSSAIAKALARSHCAIVILTSQNVNAPWVLFEAGALSRAFDKASVVPYLVDILPSDLKGPLAQFQAKSTERSATLDLVRRLNTVSDVPLTDANVAKRFTTRWPSLLRRFNVGRSQSLKHPASALAAAIDPNARVIRFDRPVDFDLYLAARIDRARLEVCDFTWKDALSSTHDLKSRKQSLREYEISIARAAQRIAYREIFIFSDPRRVDKLKRRLAEDRAGYSCRYFDTTDAAIPRVQFVLIDDDEIAFGPIGSNIKGLVAHSVDMSRLLKAYFDDVWRRAIPIKDGQRVHTKAVNKIIGLVRGGRLTSR